MNESRYTSQEPGFKLVFVALVIAAILGLSFRLYFSPKRVKQLIETELARRPSPVLVKFEGAEFSLARGSIPQIALRLIRVEGSSKQSCAKEPGFRISEVFVPFKIMSLLRGRVALGVIHGENLELDLDALRDRCALANAVDAAATQQPAPASDGSVANPSATEVVTPVEAKPWWSADEWEKVSQLIAGVSLEKLTLKFEKGRKSIFFDELVLRADVAPQTLSLITEVRIPPELLYGQTLPPFLLEATARADSADVEVRGNLGEGALMGLAQVKAIPGDVMIDAHINVSQVAISSLMPYLDKLGWAKKGFKPRFVWLNCEASITGRAQGLFKQNPLTLERCSLNGDAGQIVMDKGSIGPGAQFSPLSLDVVRVDVTKLLAMTGSEGPSGIMSKFGSVAGDLEITAPDAITFSGRFQDTEFLFSSKAVHVIQRVPELKGKVDYNKGRWTLALNEATLEGGKFQGLATVEIEADTKKGKVKLAVDELAFNPDVQKVVAHGLIKNIAIDGQGEIEEGTLQSFKGRVDVSGFSAQDLEIPSARVALTLADGKTSGKFTADSGRLKRPSKTEAAIAPVLFARSFKSDWIRLSDLSADISLVDRLFTWEKARVVLPDGNMMLKSKGRVDDQDQIKAEIQAEDVRFKNLRWDVEGTVFGPTLTPDEATRQAIQKFENQKQ